MKRSCVGGKKMLFCMGELGRDDRALKGSLSSSSSWHQDSNHFTEMANGAFVGRGSMKYSYERSIVS